MINARILVVDDELQMGRLLKTALSARGYEVKLAIDGPSTLDLAATWQPHVILLDLGLPGMDGLEVCRRIREWSQVPIIVLTVRDAEHEKVATLDGGADDYLTKPFGMDELLARIRVALRYTKHSPEAEQTVVEIGHLRIDLAHRRIYVREQEVHLTPTEYTLLHTLVTHTGKVLTHQMLLRTVWGITYERDIPTLRVFITQLRHKIEADPSRPSIIVTEPGIGYRLQLEG